MDLRSSDIVVIGAFNPAIITPMWLVEQKVVSTPGTDLPPMDLELVGARQEIRFTIDDCTWRVNPDRLILEPQSAASPAPRVKAVLEKLPHTPVRALGLNFHFQCTASEWRGGHPTLSGRGPDSLRFGGRVRQRGWNVSLTFDEHTTLNLTLRTTDTQTLVDFNFHRTTSSISALFQCLDYFEADRARARDMVAELAKEQETA